MIYFASRTRRISSRAWPLLNCAAALVLGACVVQVSAAPGQDPTAFLQTRVPQVMTENALTNAAPSVSATPPLPTSTAPPQLSVATYTPAPPSPTVSGLKVATYTPIALPTAGASVTPPLAAGATNTPSQPCADQACADSAEHFWLERPISPTFTDYADPTYRYGSTQNGAREPHHGIEFVNLSGTPVIAAGAGTVVVAGNDWTTAYGPSLYFYGNLVAVQLDQTYNGQAVFNLYAHLESVAVQPGQRVNVGDVLGAVGYTGVAVGPHLHFEVRVGRNDYFATRNPELWLKPLRYNGKYWGLIAGRVQTADGTPVDDYTVVIRPLAVEYDAPKVKFITTYARETLNGDDRLQENFAVSDMPLGTYTVSVNTTTLYQQTVTVTAGHITWVTFTVEPPAQ